MKQNKEIPLAETVTEKPKRHGIAVRWKFFGYMMLFMLLLLALLWSFQVIFFEEIYKRVKINEIDRAADILETHCDDDTEQLDTLASQIAQDCDVCVIVYDTAGSVLITRHYVQDCSIHRMDDMSLVWLYYLARRNGGAKLTRYPLNDNRRLNYYAEDYTENMSPNKSSLGESLICTRIAYSKSRNMDLVFVLNTTISPVDSTVKTLRTELILISVAMVIAALILSLLLARRIARPIVKINESAKLLADGHYDVKFAADGYREISELSGTLNYAAEELAKTGNLQKELVANISHDLRTPLTMIEGYAEIMRDIPGENTPENVQIIIDETKRLSSLVNDVLDISRLQSGTQELKLSDFNLTETVREVIGRFSKLTEQNGWEIRFHADDEVMVNADRTRILQVIYNFINNAITHSGNGKIVDVNQTVIRKDNHTAKVRISVTDYGEGIAAENIPYIWDRYYKVDKTHRRAQTGSGLGLSIVKSILELHHAAYGVDSILGSGSTFWFEL